MAAYLEHSTRHQYLCRDTDGAKTAAIIVFHRDLKNFCFILSTGTEIRIDSVMRPRSSSRGRNTSASVTVTVTE